MVGESLKEPDWTRALGDYAKGYRSQYHFGIFDTGIVCFVAKNR